MPITTKNPAAMRWYLRKRIFREGILYRLLGCGYVHFAKWVVCAPTASVWSNRHPHNSCIFICWRSSLHTVISKCGPELFLLIPHVHELCIEDKSVGWLKEIPCVNRGIRYKESDFGSLIAGLKDIFHRLILANDVSDSWAVLYQNSVV